MKLFCRSLLTIALFAGYADSLSGNIDQIKRAKLNRLSEEQRALSKARSKALSETAAKTEARSKISEVRDNNGELVPLMARTSRDKRETPDQFLYRVIFNLANIERLGVSQEK